MPETIEHDHFPEVVDNGKGTHRLELLNIKEDLRTPSERRRYFTELPNEDFHRMVGYVNSITRGEKISYEYEDGQFPMGETPELEEKGDLMELTFDTVKEILTDDEIDDETALRRAGLTLAGAINYIHPFKNGNGRTGRVLHYLIEFGSERGDDSFNNEMYAAIAKLPAYEGDTAKAISNTPPVELEPSINAYLSAHREVTESNLSPRAQASARVVAFLDMMRGQAEILISQDAVFMDTVNGVKKRFDAGSVDGRQLYEALYVGQSTTPNRMPVNGANPIRAEKRQPRGTISLSIDLV